MPAAPDDQTVPAQPPESDANVQAVAAARAWRRVALILSAMVVLLVAAGSVTGSVFAGSCPTHQGCEAAKGGWSIWNLPLE
jgi:hypothetical protein